MKEGEVELTLSWRMTMAVLGAFMLWSSDGTKGRKKRENVLNA